MALHNTSLSGTLFRNCLLGCCSQTSVSVEALDLNLLVSFKGVCSFVVAIWAIVRPAELVFNIALIVISRASVRRVTAFIFHI